MDCFNLPIAESPLKWDMAAVRARNGPKEKLLIQPPTHSDGLAIEPEYDPFLLSVYRFSYNLPTILQSRFRTAC